MSILMSHGVRSARLTSVIRSLKVAEGLQSHAETLAQDLSADGVMPSTVEANTNDLLTQACGLMDAAINDLVAIDTRWRGKVQVGMPNGYHHCDVDLVDVGSGLGELTAETAGGGDPGNVFDVFDADDVALILHDADGDHGGTYVVNIDGAQMLQFTGAIAGAADDGDDRTIEVELDDRVPAESTATAICGISATPGASPATVLGSSFTGEFLGFLLTNDRTNPVPASTVVVTRNSDGAVIHPGLSLAGAGGYASYFIRPSMRFSHDRVKFIFTHAGGAGPWDISIDIIYRP